MKWFESFSLVMRSHISALQEKIENPELMLHQLILDMEEEHERIRARVAGAVADEIHLEKQAQQAREEVKQWLDRAASALKRGDEPAARAALEQKVLAEERAEFCAGEHVKQKEQTAQLHRSLRDLEQKIRQADQKRTLLVARLTCADSAQRINQSMESSRCSSALGHLQRLEKKVERAEALN